MATHGIKRPLRAAMDAVEREIATLSEGGGRYSRGLASEGYMGGYSAALEDVLLALNGVEPDRWRKWRTQAEPR